MSELNRTFVATAIGVFGAMSMLAGGITQQSGDSTSTMVKVENLDPYTPCQYSRRLRPIVYKIPRGQED